VSVTTSPVTMPMVCCVLVQTMALVYAASASASPIGQAMHVLVELLALPVSLQVVGKSAQAMETASVGRVNAMTGRKDVSRESSARSFQ
jgi:hypothetical protein